MAVVPISPEPQVELVDGVVRAREIGFHGTIVDVVLDLKLQDNPSRLSRLLTDAVEVGAVVLRNGQSQALVESVALEIDRLIDTANSETEKLPQAIEQQLKGQLTRLSELLAEHFDPNRAHSLPNQLRTIVGAATGAEVRTLVEELLGESGALGSQFKLVNTSSAEMLIAVNTLLGKVEQRLQLDDVIERSAHKGRRFEEVVHAELEAIHGPLGDDVRCVRSEYGLLPKGGKGARAGDYIVSINPEHTRGRDVSYVIEAKAGPLNAAASRRELETAMKNRGAVAGVLVFDGAADAPLGGRSYMPHGDGRFTAVLDMEDGVPLAFEVACRQARLSAVASVQTDGRLDPAWLESHCNRLCEVIEGASAILRSLSTIERGAADGRDIYNDMRRDALALIDEARVRLDPT